MNFLKKIIDDYLENFFEERKIEMMCWDTETNGDLNFYITMQSYPPIGTLINIERMSRLFKIESIEIQGNKGAFCIAKGVFIN